MDVGFLSRHADSIIKPDIEERNGHLQERLEFLHDSLPGNYISVMFVNLA